MMIALCLFFLTFTTIDETIPQGPFCYPGKTKREVITFDPSNSPEFDCLYSKFKQQINNLKNEEDILYSLLSYVQREVFDLPNCSNLQVIKTILDEDDLYIPLDVFLREKKGVCRHMSLYVTLMIHRLIEEECLFGRVYLIRDDLPQGRHAWTLFITETGAWHLDAYQGIFENGKTGAGFSNLCQKYGMDVMNRQLQRWNDDA